MKIVQINSSCGSGSTGKIAYAIHEKLDEQGVENYVFYSGFKVLAKTNCIAINSKTDIRYHQIAARCFGDQGWHSTCATKKLIRRLKEISPNLVHLHNLHGYYLNLTLLFNYLAKAQIPVVWTLHDCWAFTGHCPHFTKVGCERWKTQCEACPQYKGYPYSLFFDRSKTLFNRKRSLYKSVKNMTVTTVSHWLNKMTKESKLLGEREVVTIPNGINTEVFRPRPSVREIDGYSLVGKKVVLGVASTWSERKGMADFLQLRERLSEEYLIVLVGVTADQKKMLPKGVLGVMRTQNVEELSQLYSSANVFFNASEEETFGLTTIEAISCGTPSIVYDATACAEPIRKEVGSVVSPRDIQAVVREIEKWCAVEKDMEFCNRLHAYVQENYDEKAIYEKYVELYKELITVDKGI